MSWLFSRALVEEYSAQCCLGTEPCVQSSVMPMPDQFYWPDKPMEHSRLSRFGMMCVPLMDGLGEELLKLCLADFRARTSVLPVKGPDWTASGQGYGQKWLGSLGKYDPATHSLKTAQHSLFEDLTECSPTLPRSGLMRDGELWELPTLAHRTAASESGFWATPAASDSQRGGTITPAMTGQSLVQMVNTPEYWPTPTVCGNYNRKGVSANSGDGIATAVSQRMYPTATATAYKGWSQNHNRADTDDRLDYTIEREGFSPGQQTPPMRLNPDWVEWLMGWPIGQTELKPLATDRFRVFEQQHGGF